MPVRTIQIVENILANNDELAALNRQRFDEAGVLTINVMASPGAGKTSLIVRTIDELKGRARVGVIEGDIAGSIDGERVLAAGAAGAVQINTGGSCHLEASMLQRALDHLELPALDVVFVENVGNLVCPTHWELGERIKLCILSAPEGHDKPVKYPQLFAASDVIVLNKVDLIDFVDFDRDFFYDSLRALNQDAQVFEISCRTGEGVEEWAEWVLSKWSGQ
jgi:hydrogenase nickel incorporation protein HypB